MIKIPRFLFAQVLFVLCFGVAASFAQSSPGNFPSVHIKNFGQMDDRFYRGAQPEPNDYQALADLGVKTIIDLRNDPTDYEKADAEAVGIKYINIQMSGWKSPKDPQIQQFLELVNNPETGVFYVHCKAGIHRTGVAGAVYRFTKYGWDYDQAYKEMKNYDFSAGWVHGALKDFVEDYATKLRKDKPAVAVVAASGSQTAQ
jgi:tyrosine-protein phosphatase SIW14